MNLSKSCVERLKKFLPLVSERCSSLGEIFESASFLLENKDVRNQKSLVSIDDKSSSIIKDFISSIKSANLTWEAQYLEDFINNYCEKNNLKFRDIGVPLRILITGSTSSPSIVQIMEILGLNETFHRLNMDAGSIKN